MRRAALATFAALLAWAPAARMPGPARADYTRSSRAEKNATCVRCHGATAREHDASLHAVSFSDASFQRGYALEAKEFCRACHAPESKPDATPDVFARGLACVTCHVPDDAAPVLAGAGTSTKAPHAIVRVPDLGTRACARCHEFSFTNSEALGTRGLMQRTLTEHAESAARDRSCASCHMPQHGHRFAASRDVAFLANALEVRAERSGADLVFTLRARGVGHAFPTGDLFRRLVLRARGPFGVVSEELGRSFGSSRDDRDRVVHFETGDRRLAPEQRVELFTKDPISWEVVYQRVTFASQLPPYESTVEAETILAHGVL